MRFYCKRPWQGRRSALLTIVDRIIKFEQGRKRLLNGRQPKCCCPGPKPNGRSAFSLVAPANTSGPQLATAIGGGLGSGLIDHSQKMTVAAMQMADMKVWAHFIVAGVDASPVLEPTEHVFDLVALAVQRSVVRDRDFAVGLGWDARRDAALAQRQAEPVRVIAPVAEHRLGFGKGIDHQRRALIVAHLIF